MTSEAQGGGGRDPAPHSNIIALYALAVSRPGNNEVVSTTKQVINDHIRPKRKTLKQGIYFKLVNFA